MRILFLQHGNYAEAYRRFGMGGRETYRYQRASVEYVADLARDSSVAVVAICGEVHDESLEPNLRSIGVTAADFGSAAIAAILDDVRPDRLICRTPRTDILRQARSRGIPTLPLFADLFRTAGLKSFVKNMQLRMAVSGTNVPCIGNHSVNASRSVARALAYPRSRVVPWDWRRIDAVPDPKAGPADARAPTVFYAGMLTAQKGVEDCLRAVRKLHDRGIRASISFAGHGDFDFWRGLAAELGLEGSARFLGRISSDDVLKAMRAHDIVLVPSRHDYPEGFPMTINEGLASRSPLVISDHPAFHGRLKPGTDCLVFRAADPASLADSIARLAADRALYAALSGNSAGALDRLYVRLEWFRLIDMFLDDPANSGGWVERNSLEALNL